MDNESQEQHDVEDQAGVEIDPHRLDSFLQEMETNQSLTSGILAGLAAAIVGAGLWAIITAVTGYQIGWMAVGVGLLVGFSVRIFGKGFDNTFGMVGAVLSLLGCLLGNLLAVCIIFSRAEAIPFWGLITGLTPEMVIDIMKVTFEPIDLLFYAIAVYEGYKFSFREVTEKEIRELAK